MKWWDLNQDGLSQTNELFTLPAAGIASITVQKAENNTLLPSGNDLADTGSYTKTDSSVGATADVWFQTDKLYTIQEEYLDVPAVLAAPEKFIGCGADDAFCDVYDA